jgi:hypothetical protein
MRNSRLDANSLQCPLLIEVLLIGGVTSEVRELRRAEWIKESLLDTLEITESSGRLEPRPDRNPLRITERCNRTVRLNWRQSISLPGLRVIESSAFLDASLANHAPVDIGALENPLAQSGATGKKRSNELNHVTENNIVCWGFSSTSLGRNPQRTLEGPSRDRSCAD